jgi:hypothetical protein
MKKIYGWICDFKGLRVVFSERRIGHFSKSSWTKTEFFSESPKFLRVWKSALTCFFVAHYSRMVQS